MSQGFTRDRMVWGDNGVKSFLPLDVPPRLPHAKDDEFIGTALDAKWTNPTTSASGQTNTIVVGNGAVSIEPETTGTGSTGKRVFGIRQAAPSGSFTVSAKISESGIGNDIRSGVFVATSGGVAWICGPFLQDSGSGYIGVTTASDTADWSTYNGVTGAVSGFHNIGWAKIVWDSGASTLSFYHSIRGYIWTKLADRTGESQPGQIGLCIYSNSAAILAHELISVDWFRVTEP